MEWRCLLTGCLGPSNLLWFTSYGTRVVSRLSKSTIGILFMVFFTDLVVSITRVLDRLLIFVVHLITRFHLNSLQRTIKYVKREKTRTKSFIKNIYKHTNEFDVCCVSTLSVDYVIQLSQSKTLIELIDFITQVQYFRFILF